MTMAKPRSRLLYAALMLTVTGLGLLSRSHLISLPSFVALYAGDTLWALLVVLGLGFLCPRLAVPYVIFAAASFSLFIELSQLYHTPWLDALRNNRLAALVLGQGFLWSDLLCYTVGIGVGAAFELVRIRLSHTQDLQA